MEQKFFQILASIGLCFLLAACSTSGPEICEFRSEGMTLAPKKATSRPYQIKGVWYYPQPHYEYDEEGMASFYGGGDVFHGRPTATGERYDMNGITAAHKTLPLPCMAKVINLENGREVVVKVNDRGPFPPGRLIDVSRRVAQLLGFENKGLVKVRVTTIVSESLALNGIDPSTVMVAQAPSSPITAPVLLPSVPAIPIGTGAIAAAPDTLFEALEGAAAVADEVSVPIPTPVPIVMAEVPPSTAPVMVAEAPLPEPMMIPDTPSAPVVEKQPSQLPVKLEAPSTGIFVYVGAYETLAKAQSVSSSLEGFADSPIGTVRNNGAKPYAATLGPFPSMFQANQVLDQLVNAGHLISRIVIQR